MGNSDKGKAKESKGSDAPGPAPLAQAKGASSSVGVEEMTTKVRRFACCRPCFKILFVVLSLSTSIWSIAEIVVTVSTAIATRLFGSEQSGRLVAMILLALLAAATISILIYAKTAVFRNQTKPLHAAAIVLVLIALIQAVVTGVAVRVTRQDEQSLTRDLQTSFRLARDNNPRHAQIWSAMQHELMCCGVGGPNDYRTSNLPDYFAPNVPISCCPEFDPNRSELVQERNREMCKARKTFYHVGCREMVLEGFRTSAHMVTGITTTLIVLEVLLAITASILYKKMKRQKRLFSSEAKP